MKGNLFTPGSIKWNRKINCLQTGLPNTSTGLSCLENKESHPPITALVEPDIYMMDHSNKYSSVHACWKVICMGFKKNSLAFTFSHISPSKFAWNVNSPHLFFKCMLLSLLYKIHMFEYRLPSFIIKMVKRQTFLRWCMLDFSKHFPILHRCTSQRTKKKKNVTTAITLLL